MTTVDVRIEALDSGDRISLHNGLWGPATRVLHAFGDACRDGRIQTRWNVAEIRAVTTGAIVREALSSIADADWKHSLDETDPRRVAAFLDHLNDDANYKIFALEV